MTKFAKLLILRWLRVEVGILAASLAFNSVLVIVPLLAVSLAVFHYVGGMESMLDWIQINLREYFVFGTQSFIIEKIEESVQRIHSGALGSLGILFVFMTCSRLYWQFDRAVQKIWGGDRDLWRWRQLLIFWLLLLVGPLTFGVILGVIPALLLKGAHIQIGAFSGHLALFAFLLFIYRAVPNTEVKWGVAIGSAVFSLVSLVLVKRFFVNLTVDLMSYSRVYGSMAALPVFLIWLLILWWIILFGYAVGAQWQESLAESRNSEKK